MQYGYNFNLSASFNCNRSIALLLFMMAYHETCGPCSPLGTPPPPPRDPDPLLSILPVIKEIEKIYF